MAPSMDDCVPPYTEPPLSMGSRAVARARGEPRGPVRPPFDRVWAAALQAEAALPQHGERAARVAALQGLWERLASGRLEILSETFGSAGVTLLACTDDGLSPNTPWSRRDARLVRRLWSGEPVAGVALDLGFECPSAVRRYRHALGMMSLSPRPVPLALLLAARTAGGLDAPSRVRSVAFELDRWRCALVAVPRAFPPSAASSGLTFAEREVARLVVDGCSAHQIATRRATSVHATLRHLRAVFVKARVTGRFALVRRAVECDWFR